MVIIEAIITGFNTVFYITMDGEFIEQGMSGVSCRFGIYFVCRIHSGDSSVVGVCVFNGKACKLSSSVY